MHIWSWGKPIDKDIYKMPLATTKIAEGVYKSDIFKPDEKEEEKL